MLDRLRERHVSLQQMQPQSKEPEAEVLRNDAFDRITNVSRPTLTLFPLVPKTP